MNWENELSKWTTKIDVNGPIEIDKREISFRSRKDIEQGNPLYSNIIIKNISNGVELTVNSFAPDIFYGQKAALIFTSLALDVLCVKSKCPLYADIKGKRPGMIRKEYNINRTIEEEEWRFAFTESRLLTLTEPTFLRALSWYRKGLCSEDPLDKMLAFWNSIEVVSSKYHTQNDKTKNGIKNQIWQCFDDLWGNYEGWKIINGQKDWIEINYDERNNVAHGIISIDVTSIEKITSKLDIIEQLAHVFLIDWRKHKLNPKNKITPEIQEKLEVKDWIKIQ